MTTTPMAMSRLAWVSSATFLFTIPHSIEDFTNGIAHRFGLSVVVAAVSLGIAFAVQVWATAALDWKPRLARWLLLLIGVTWVIGALVDHVPDLIGATWRSGVPSKALVVGIIVGQAVVVAFSTIELFSRSSGSV
jgi:hypothetical protein